MRVRALDECSVVDSVHLPTLFPTASLRQVDPTSDTDGTLFGDGLRCAGGSVNRWGTKTASGGAASYPSLIDISSSVRGNVVPGNTRHYRAHYRNSAAC